MDGIRFGRGIRALRRQRDWRQEDLAAAAGVSRGVVARIEQGRGARVTVQTLDRVAAALEARVDVRLHRQAERLDRLIDAGHALLVDGVLAELTVLGWRCAPEVTFSIYGERGSIDVLANHPAAGTLLVVEVKSSLPEIGNLVLALDRKARLAPRIAEDRGWTAGSVARLLVVGESRTTRRRLEQHAATFDAAFPVRGWEVRRWLRAPSPTPGWSGLWIPSFDPDRSTATA